MGLEGYDYVGNFSLDFCCWVFGSQSVCCCICEVFHTLLYVVVRVHNNNTGIFVCWRYGNGGYLFCQVG